MIKTIKKYFDDDNKDIQAINEIATKCDLTNNDVSKVMATLFTHLMQKYVNDEAMYIPFVGELKLNYKGDKETSKGLYSEVESSIELSDLMRIDVARFKNMEDVYFDKMQMYEIKDLTKKLLS